MSSFSFSFSSRWHCSALKGPYALRSVSQQSPQGCSRNSANICLVEHRPILIAEGGMLAAFFFSPLLFLSGDQCCDALMRKFLKPRSTSAMPSCRPDVIFAVLASLSARSFPLTPACPGQETRMVCPCIMMSSNRRARAADQSL